MIESVRFLRSWASAHQRQALWGIIVLILVVHLLAATLFTSGDQSSDEQLYIRLADNLLMNGTFGRTPSEPFALVPPVYPFFVAAILAISNHSLLAVRIAQAIVGTVNSLVVFKLCQMLFPRRPAIAWLSMLSVGLYPVFFLWEGRILTETIYTLTVLLCFWWWARSVRFPTTLNILLVGIGFGFSMLTRETLHLFIPVLMLVTLFIIREHWHRYILLVALSFIVTVTPWVVRNYIVFDHVFFTERTAYLVHNLRGKGYLSPYYREWIAKQAALGASPQALDVNNLAYTPARYVRDLSFARQQPVLYARILFARLLELWGHPNGLNRLPQSLRWAYQIGHWGLLLMAVIGLRIAALNRYKVLLAWSIILLPYVTAFGIYVKPNPRYTLPFLPLVFILATLALDFGLHRIKEVKGYELA